MEYKDNFQLDAGQVSGAGGGGGRGGMAIGGIGGLIVLILSLIFGINPGNLLGQDQQAPSGQEQQDDAYARCNNTEQLKQNRDCRITVYTNAVQSYWKGQVNNYEVTQTKPFQGSTQTACGNATAAVGPFYCPADHLVYLDLSFFDQLTSQLGAQGGDAAEAYVIAHEYGHHIQNLTGSMEKAQQMGQEKGPESGSVRLELQADCYAGAFFQGTLKDPNSPIKSITKDDVMRAADAARAVGDDRIQSEMQGRVDRESWTHGSSRARQKWLVAGMKGGPAACNTFDPNVDLGE